MRSSFSSSIFHLVLLAVLLSVVPVVAADPLLDSLGQAYAGGDDPYVHEYVEAHQMMRFPVLVRREGDRFLIDNFRDGATKDPDTGEQQGRWTSALVDASKVRTVTFVMGRFTVKVGPVKIQAGHAQMLYEFEPGGVRTPSGEIGGLVVSYEAYRGRGVSFNAVKGLAHAYRSIFVVGSRVDTFEKAAPTYTDVDFYELDLSREQMRTLLVRSLETSFDRSYLEQKWYHTTRSSCVTWQVTLLNEVLRDRKLDEWHTLFGKNTIRTFGTTFPTKVGPHLEKAGLVVKSDSFVCPDALAAYGVIRCKGDAVTPDRRARFERLYGRGE